MKNKIIVPTDLTKVANHAIEQAVIIALKTKKDLVLLHVLNDKSPAFEEVQKTLQTQVEDIRKSSGISCDFITKEGNIFEVIPHIACEHDFDLMVIGTHGIQGMRQALFGSNILRLVSKLSMPVLVLQEETPIKEDFPRIVFPVSSHESFGEAVKIVIQFAHYFNSEVVLYSVYKSGFEWPENMISNIEKAVQQFEEKGISLKRIKEDQTVYSLGYAKQTLKFAHESQADLIAIIPSSSKEYYYFAQTDKETLLLNDHHLPTLCVGGSCFCE